MSAKVLVVENRSPYAEKACQQLRERGLDAISVPDPKMIGIAKKDPAQYETAVLHTVQSMLEDQPFEVIIINLNLSDEGDDLFGQCDLLGVVILEHVISKYPGMYCIICTALRRGRANFFLDRFPGVMIVYK